ncbi:MAG: YkgJ family cysteine cluster protein [Deltaproteobacteria bacterium]|nr:YkgJ family cysteine cluster protein [Deltaproteobacteria bacterium]
MTKKPRPPGSIDAGRARALLQQASDVVAGTGCDCSTECCRFGLTGREPWVTRAEWELVVREVARQGRRLPVVRDDDDDDEGRCPFLDDDGKGGGRCRVYAARPLGCRTFFCERAVHADGRRGKLPTATTRTLRPLAGELAALSPGVEARPLRSWLRGR